MQRARRARLTRLVVAPEPTVLEAALTRDAASPSHTLQWAILLYVVAMVVLLTLAPFTFTWPADWHIDVWSDRTDAPANFLLFLPIGYCFRLTRHPHAVAAPLQALLFGAVLSVAIESTQLFIPERLTSLFDVIGNALGAWAGAVLCQALRRRLDRRLPRVLALEHPLMSLNCLLLPLMWLASLSSDPRRVWLLAPLGMVGTLTFTGLWRYRFHAASDLPPAPLALTIAGWFVFGAIGAVATAAHVVAICTAGVWGLSYALLRWRGRYRGTERRFAARILRRLWPCYGLYLVMLVAWPLPSGYFSFSVIAGYPDFDFTRDVAMRVAEQIGALTVFGYLVAESFGRRAHATRRHVALNLAIVTTAALLLEIPHGLLLDDRASVTRWLLGSAAAAFGVVLSRLQLDFVRMLRGASG